MYIESVKDVQKRKCLTQFRVSAHRLEIESGRYKKKSVSERICKYCKLNAVEDEVHFLCNCSAYQTFLVLLSTKFLLLGYSMIWQNLYGS